MSDRRYELIRIMYDDDHIHRLRDIFKYIPKSIVARDAGMNIDQINARLKSPDKFLVRQVFRIGELCGLEKDEMLELLMGEYRAKKRQI